MQFCKKKIMGVKKKKKKKKATTTQNDFVYGELGRVNYVTKRYYIIIKYWFKVLSTPENKFVQLQQFNVSSQLTNETLTISIL